jgi:hypothetical protein
MNEAKCAAFGAARPLRPLLRGPTAHADDSQVLALAIAICCMACTLTQGAAAQSAPRTTPPGGRSSYRIAIEYYNGRPTVAEFSIIRKPV